MIFTYDKHVVSDYFSSEMKKVKKSDGVSRRTFRGLKCGLVPLKESSVKMFPVVSVMVSPMIQLVNTKRSIKYSAHLQTFPCPE